MPPKQTNSQCPAPHLSGRVATAGDVGATATADIQDLAVLLDLHRRQGPVGHLGVTAAVHPVHHHLAEEAFGLARIAENLTK